MNWPLDAVEQGYGKLVLQFAQVGGHGRLAQFQPAGGFGDASQLGHVVKTDNFPQLDENPSLWAASPLFRVSFGKSADRQSLCTGD